MTISVIEARNLVVLACWGGSRGDPNSFHVAPAPNTTLDAALDVYVEARVAAERKVLATGVRVESVTGLALGSVNDGLKIGTCGTVDSGPDSDGDWYVVFDDDVELYVRPEEIRVIA